VPGKCKFYSPDASAWEDIQRRDIIPITLNHIYEGIFITNEGDNMRGLQVFNVPVGDAKYVAAVLRSKATQVTATTRKYVEDLEDKTPPRNFGLCSNTPFSTWLHNG
jgi:hypothetical protein